MKFHHTFVALCGLLIITTNAYSGWFSRFEDPPVVLSFHKNTGDWPTIHVTNTSDTIIYAVVLTSSDGKTSVTLADTIQPHQTVIYKLIDPDSVKVISPEMTITCKDYGSMKIKPIIEP